MANIKRLLNKKEWTGRELGILELTNTAVMFQQALEGKEQQPIVEREQLQRMINNISDSHQGHIYNGYIAIHQWLSIYYNIAQTQFQQAQLQFRTLEGYVERAILAEDVYSYIEEIPAIMTQKQYEAIRAERIEEVMTDKDGRDLYVCLFDLIERACMYYALQLRASPRKRNPLNAIRKKYINEPVKSAIVLSALEQTDPPLTKWDVIEQDLLLECYPADLDGSGDVWSENNFILSMEDFAAEFKDLVSVLLADIDKYNLMGEFKLSDFPIRKWADDVFPVRQLYEENIYGERDTIESDTIIFDGNKRALLNGIAIVRDSDFIPSRRIDDRGFYTEPDIQGSLSAYSLQGLFTTSETYADNVAIVESSRRSLIESYYNVKGYNYALEIIGRYYDVPEMTVFQMRADALEDKIDALNGLISLLCKRIEMTEYGDTELKEKKLQVLTDFFQPVDYKALEIPEENKEAAERLLEDFRAFRAEWKDRFYSLLCTLPEAEEADEEGGEAE